MSYLIIKNIFADILFNFWFIKMALIGFGISNIILLIPFTIFMIKYIKQKRKGKMEVVYEKI
jgi:hypothetical protein